MKYCTVAIMTSIVILLAMNNALIAEEKVEQWEEEGNVKQLITALNDKTSRMKAALALGRIGEPAIDPLIAVVTDRNRGERGMAMLALAIVGEEVDGDERIVNVFLDCLTDKDDSIRQNAAGILAKLGEQKRLGKQRAIVFRALLKALTDSCDAVRKNAAGGLSDTIGDDAKIANKREAVVKTLYVALKDKNLIVRNSVAHLLSRVNAIPDKKTEEYAWYLTSKLKWDMLARSEMPVDPVVDALTAILNENLDDKYVKIKYQALLAIRRLGREGAPATNTLLALLADRTQFQVHEGGPEPATSGGWVHEGGPEPVTSGGFTVTGSKTIMRMANLGSEAARTLVMIAEPKALVPKLVKRLESEDSDERENAAVALGLLGSDAKEAVPALQKLVQDSEGFVSSEAKKAIERIEGPSNQSAEQGAPADADKQRR